MLPTQITWKFLEDRFVSWQVSEVAAYGGQLAVHGATRRGELTAGSSRLREGDFQSEGRLNSSSSQNLIKE